MSFLTCLPLLGLLALAMAEPKVVHMPMTRNRNANNLYKRATVNVTVVNDVFDGLYFVNATIGNPPQLVQLQIDTGSSDVWFFGPKSCDETSSPCLGGFCKCCLFVCTRGLSSILRLYCPVPDRCGTSLAMDRN